MHFAAYEPEDRVRSLFHQPHGDRAAQVLFHLGSLVRVVEQRGLLGSPVGDAARSVAVQMLSLIGSFPIHWTVIAKVDAHLMGFCSAGQIRYDEVEQTVALRVLPCRYSLLRDGAPSSPRKGLPPVSVSTSTATFAVGLRATSACGALGVNTSFNRMK